MQLVTRNNSQQFHQKRYIEGGYFMAIVKVIPLYEEGNPNPVMFKFGNLNKIEKRQKKEDISESQDLDVHVGDSELI